MSVLVGGYQGAKSCTTGPQVGTKNLMSVFMARYGTRGGRNLGIYNCRTVRGGSTTSLHGEGRAGDHGCPVKNDFMQGWVDFLVAYSKELGIQCVIYNRRIWSSSYASQGWRPYSGVSPHTDHAHVEQTWDSARTLTVARIYEVLNGVPAVDAPAGGITWTDVVDAAPGTRVLSLGSRGSDVAFVQRWIGIKDDGEFGLGTEDRVKWYQGERRLTKDGVVGPDTWAHMGVGGPPAPVRKSNDEIAREALAGQWGNGDERKQRLAGAGYDPAAVQAVINSTLRKSVSTLATEVLQGKWGNGKEREQRLRAQGYDPDAVQAEVNRRV